jgi:uncharacterized protein
LAERRLLVLLAFGLIHLLGIWNGDILTEYAVAGLCVLPLLYASKRGLLTVGMALLVLYLAMPVLPPALPWPDAGWITAHIAQANAVYRAGSWMQVMHFGWQELPALLPLHVYIFPRTLGLFVLGMLAWRSGLFAYPAKHRSAIFHLAWVGGACGTALTMSDACGLFPPTGLAGSLPNIAPVCLALAFAATVVYAVEFTPAAASLAGFSAIGRMAFTNYIAQSVVFGLVFFGYGLGLFGSLRPAPVFVMGVTVYALQVQFSRLWLRHYRFGPIEWLWRTLMYGRRPAMKR